MSDLYRQLYSRTVEKGNGWTHIGAPEPVELVRCPTCEGDGHTLIKRDGGAGHTFYADDCPDCLTDRDGNPTGYTLISADD